MPREFLLLAVSIIAWVIFGAIIGGVGTLILNYTWVIDVVFYGAVVGAVIGLGIGLLGLVVAFIVRSREVIIWIIGSSIVGAIVGFGIVIVVGSYPTRTQADLGFITLGAAGLGVGGSLGILVGIGIWKSRLG